MASDGEPDRGGATGQIFFLMPWDLSWWVWGVTACLLALGLAGHEVGFVGAIALSILQSIYWLVRERRWAAFPVQVRVGYTALLAVCFLPGMRWLYWLPTVGTFALIMFGYCLMVRVLSLLPWNREERVTIDLLRRTFFSRPRIGESGRGQTSCGCAGGVCSIDAQVKRPDPVTS